MRRLLILGMMAIGATALGSAGCNHGCPRPQPAPQPPPGTYLPGPPPGTGGAPFGPLPKGTQQLPEPPPPAPIGSFSKSPDPFEMQQQPTWKPGTTNPPTVRLYPPEVVTSPDGGQSGGVRLKQPEVVDPAIQPPPPPPPAVQEAVEPPPAPTPKVEVEVKAKPSATPVGIAQFALVRDKLATGLRPSLDDGLDWLQASGYKTMLLLHSPGEADSADRKQVEKRGLKFVSLEVSPATLSSKQVADFNAILAAQGEGALYVYDRDGALTGAMWYLHFRTAQQADEEKARMQANSLGLREDREGLHRDMWQAAQKVANPEADDTK